jgi:hypothetical protein
MNTRHYRRAVRDDAELPWSRSPGAHPAGVDMHRVGCRIVADTATLNRERRVAKNGQRHVSEPNVDGLSLHVQAAGRHAFAARSEGLVGRGKSIAGNHLKRLRTFGDASQPMEQVEQRGVDDMHFAGAEITQEMVDGVEGIVQVLSAAEGLDREPLAGVGVSEFKLVAGERTRGDPA